MMNNTPRSFVGSTTFRVNGMTCSHCEQAVTAEIFAVPGVHQVSVDLPTGTVTVSVTQPVDRADIAAAIHEAGYTLLP